MLGSNECYEKQQGKNKKMETLRKGCHFGLGVREIISEQTSEGKKMWTISCHFFSLCVCFKELENGDRYYHGKNGNMCLIWIVYLEPAL